MDTKQGALSRSGLYKALALVAWAQQGKEVSSKLLDNFSGGGKHTTMTAHIGIRAIPT